MSMRSAIAICLLASCGSRAAETGLPSGWAALPDRVDAADRGPPSGLPQDLLGDRQDAARVDAFVVLCPADDLALTRYASALHHDARIFVPECTDEAAARRAFAEFRARWNGDRPLTLAAAEGGVPTLDGLLRDEVAGGPLADRLVAAWRIGAPSAAPPLAACTDAADARHTARHSGVRSGRRRV